MDDLIGPSGVIIICFSRHPARSGHEGLREDTFRVKEFQTSHAWLGHCPEKLDQWFCPRGVTESPACLFSMDPFSKHKLLFSPDGVIQTYLYHQFVLLCRRVSLNRHIMHVTTEKTTAY